jgi:CIC family chloride channel protein
LQEKLTRFGAKVLGLVEHIWDLSRRGPVMSETQRFLLLSIVIGIFAGLVVVCFHISIEFLAWSTIHAGGGHGWILTVLWPALGGGIAYLLVMTVFPAARGSGVNNTKAALYVSDGYVPFHSVPGKFIASTISIGSGNPMGPEDPALQMGAGVASLLGRLFHLTRENMRLIAPIGAAAGIGAAFNTPITAVLFVMEEVVASWNGGVLGSIVLSAVSAVVVSRWYLGDDPLFRVPQFELTHPTELIVYAVIGVVGGVLSAYFTRWAGRLRRGAIGMPLRVRFALPVLAGMIVGAVGVWLPEILGAGYGAIDSALHDRFPWHILILLGLLKMLTASMCFSAGTPGGMFAPTLFIGAMLGGGLGALAQLYSPFPTSTAGAYVLVGIGTFFVGVFRAPMTSIFMVFEISASYVIILPVMIANTVSYLISRRLQRDSLFHIIGHQDGLDLPSVEEQREAPILSVEDAMATGSSRVLRHDMTVAKALAQMQSDSLQQALVAIRPGTWGWLERRDLEARLAQGADDETIEDSVRDAAGEHLYPDLSLDSALHRLSSRPILPVSSRANPNEILGSLTLADVHLAYGIE